MLKVVIKSFLAILVVFTALPALAASSNFEVSGWIPYWRKATGTAEAITHIKVFTELSPFGFTVKNDGTLFDAAGIYQDPWPALITKAKANKVRIIPTVMWANASAINTVLRSPKLRTLHVNQIVQMVWGHGFDGVDIDYEAKFAETSPYFSLFLKELYAAIGNKWVICSIEPRTPLTSRYDTIPPDIAYANDFVAINKYCDRVKIMAYDQGTIDIRLNTAGAVPYVPVADPQWVEKVVTLAVKDIKKSKIILGVPTYGYEWELTPLSQQGYNYDLLWAFNPKYATGIASSVGARPMRNRAGELSFSYLPTTTPKSLTDIDSNLSNNNNLNVANNNLTFSDNLHVLWWSDASAIKAKIALAKKLGVRGIAIFKIDGGADPELWSILK